MSDFWWKLPLLRRLSPLQRGLFLAAGLTGILCIALFPAIDSLASRPSPELCGNLAQIGATLLVAYALETSWVLKFSRIRSRNREIWVGFVGGLGLSGLAGIGLALVLEDHAGFGALAQLAFGWSAASIGFLGILVAIMPILVHDWSHSLSVEYSDE